MTTRRRLLKYLAAIPIIGLVASAFGRTRPRHAPLPDLAKMCRRSTERLQGRLNALSGVPSPGGTPSNNRTPADDLEAALVALSACHYYVTQMET